MQNALRHIVKYFSVALLLCFAAKAQANGCTGSWFQMQYSPWCNCWQVCGNYISDCDEIVSISWNFGDGTTATGESPCHQFPGPGTYTVTMTIVAYCHNTFFNLFTTTCHITQQVVVPPNTIPPLQAAFTADTSCLGDVTHFTATPTSPSGTNNYTWVWPDGTSSTGGNSTFTFDSCGVYDIMMIVTNTTPCCSISGTDTVIQRVYVDCTPFAESNTLGDTDPYIEESAGMVQVTAGSCPGDTTHFLVTPQGPLTNWVFYFPDGSFSLSPTPSYVYTACPPAIDYTVVHLFTSKGCLAIIDSLTGIFCPSNIAITPTQALCTGQCSGTATAVVGGGVAPYSLSWSDPNNQTSITATNLCPGNYTVTVTDGNGCTATPPPVTVPDFPFPFTTAVTQYNGVCCNGWACTSAVLAYSGGTPPYSCIWSNGSTNDSITGLYGGPQFVNSTDAHGCTYTSNFLVPEPPPLSATFTTVNTACGACSGSTTVTPGGGNGTYNIRWIATGQTTATINGLCSGVYLVEIEDAQVFMCRDTFSVTINENGSQPITAAATNATCANICNGTATVTLTGGCANPPCNISWLDSSGTAIGQSSATATSLCQGGYIVHVVNGAGCNSYANATVNVPNSVTATATAAYNTCGTTCNGTITASATGGSPNYSYQWYDGTGTIIGGQTGVTINGRCAGNYSVQVTDIQGCSVSATASVFNNSMTVNATANSVLCNGDCTGIITSIVTGGIQPYTFTVQNSSGGTVYTGPSNIIANLCAGNYNLAVTDAGTCVVNTPLNIAQPAALQVNPTANSPTCFGACNGSVLANASGGTAPYFYEWRNSTGQLISSAAGVSNLCHGNYAIQVKDTNNCIIPFVSVPLVQPAAIGDSLKIIDPYCDGGLGSIDLSPYGGTPPYTFNWNNGAYTTEDIGGLGSGTYIVVITDQNNCTGRDTGVFVQLPLLTVDVRAHLYNGYHFKCFNGVDGEVVVDVTGGLPPYTYQWNDSLQTTVDSIYGLSPGTYTVTVTDANGCVRIDSVVMNLVPPPFSLTEAHQDVLCAGQSNGSITITPVGGVPPYIGYWEHDNNNQQLALTGLDTGRYVVYVFDSVFCLRLDTIMLNESPPMQLSHTLVNILCNGNTTGSVNLTVNGGNDPYFFNWNNGAYNTEDLNTIGAGTYTVLVTDSNNCTMADTAVVVEPTAITTSLTRTDVTCFAGNDGSIDLTVNGGTTPYTYNWNSGQYTTQDLQGIPAGVYTLAALDTAGCAFSASVTLTEPPIKTGSRAVVICNTDSVFIGGAYQNTAGTYYDTLSTPAGCDSVLATALSLVSEFTSQFSTTVCYGQSFYYNGTYYSTSGTYTDTLSSIAGCDSVITFSLNVLPDIDLQVDPTFAKLVIGDTVSFSLIAANPGAISSYTWAPGTGLTCTDCQTTVAQPNVSTQYVAMVVDSNGCRDTVVIPVTVSGPVIFIPNVFTPNSDGANDFFEIYGDLSAITYFDVMIFNRWGEKVYASNNYNFKWDGKYKGVTQNPGVYVYVINVSFNNQPSQPLYKGSVTILR